MLPLILLHGALGAAADLLPLADMLRVDFDVHTPDFPGHGAAHLYNRPFDLWHFSEEVMQYMNLSDINRAAIFGFSMGGCVGMLAAAALQDRIAAVATLGTKYIWDEQIAESEIQNLNAEEIEAEKPAFAQSLSEMHGEASWKQIVHRTRAMISGLGVAPPFPVPEADLLDIKQPCLIMLGDRDKMVSLEEAKYIQQTLPDARLAVLPGTPHAIKRVNVEMLAFHLRRFFAGIKEKG